MSRHSDTPTFLRSIGRYLTSRFPRWRDGYLRVNVSEPSPLILPIPRSTEPEGGADRETVEEHAPAPAAELREVILAALREAGRPLKGILIARRAEKAYNGYFCRVLRQLVDDGLVIHDRDEKAYHLPSSE